MTTGNQAADFQTGSLVTSRHKRAPAQRSYGRRPWKCHWSTQCREWGGQERAEGQAAGQTSSMTGEVSKSVVIYQNSLD